MNAEVNTEYLSAAAENLRNVQDSATVTPSFYATKALSCMYRHAMRLKECQEPVPGALWNAIAKVESALEYATSAEGKERILDLAIFALEDLKQLR